MFHAEGRTDRRKGVKTHTVKLIVAFRDFASKPKTHTQWRIRGCKERGRSGMSVISDKETCLYAKAK